MTTTPEPIDPRDRIIQQHVPTVMVPSHSMLAALADPGHRYLAARDGLYLEACTRAAHLMVPVLQLDGPPWLPYGEVASNVEFVFGRLSEHKALLKQFLAEARVALPNEFAAWLVWDDNDVELRYLPCKTIEASPGRVHFERPRLDENESLAVDLHSHGTLPAFFSATDNLDDAGEVKIAGVIGNLDKPMPSAAFRICAMGLFIDVPVPKGIWA